MNLESREPLLQVLHTIGNPIRKEAVETLSKARALMTACGLDYDHDAGHFYYHLSDLIAS